jgi:hypothetical protein
MIIFFITLFTILIIAILYFFLSAYWNQMLIEKLKKETEAEILQSKKRLQILKDENAILRKIYTNNIADILIQLNNIKNKKL